MHINETFTSILREQIVPTAGRAEPLSIALCAAKAQQVLSMQPTSVTVAVSSNVLKNARSVVVPNTRGLSGIRAAVAAGIVCGDADKGMQVIGSLSAEQHEAVIRFLESTPIDVSCAETECEPYISITLYARTSYSRVVIANTYSSFVEIMKNGESLVKRPIVFRKEDPFPDPNGLCVHDIYEYARNVDPCEIRDLLDMQISFNTSICEEALSDDQRLHIGKIILSENDSDPQTIAKAYAAAGCFARMNGCDMPVASLCGSGNQGISATVPVITFARKNGISKERVYRALILSDLLTVYLIACIGKSQTVCGSILAGCAAGAAIAYLDGGDESAVARTLANALTLIYDIHCSGARPSCTVKIAGAVEIGFLGYRMYLAGQRSEEYDKTANADIDEFVRNLYRLVSDGITESDPTVTVPLPHP